uniref:Secreted protein n=1 Tax=Micrurus lemniscatus lemniscatus TaxID=129467 RepID=A0A2D4JL15_MICLE
MSCYTIVIWLLSCVQVFATLRVTTSSHPVLHCLPESDQTHVHFISDTNHHPLLSLFCLQSVLTSGSLPMQHNRRLVSRFLAEERMNLHALSNYSFFKIAKWN